MPSSRDAGAIAAIATGWRRVLRAPALTLGIWAASVAIALPFAFVVKGAIQQHLGASVDAERVAAGWDQPWAAEFAAQAQGLSRTFTYEILGFGGTLGILSAALDNERLPSPILAAVIVYIALWVFLSGGILDRLARSRPIGTAAFFAACGVYFVRFVRLALPVGVLYWVLLRGIHPLLFGTVWNAATRDMTSERDAAWLRAGLYLVFVLLLAAITLIADFAKVRMVVEDRRSALGALAAAARFVRRRPLRLATLYLLNVGILVAILAAWRLLAPAATTPVWLALLLSQSYLVLRLLAKLAFMASEVSFFQRSLAHADYTAAPPHTWPDSPSAEAIRNLTAPGAQS